MVRALDKAEVRVVNSRLYAPLFGPFVVIMVVVVLFLGAVAIILQVGGPQLK